MKDLYDRLSEDESLTDSERREIYAEETQNEQDYNDWCNGF